MTLLRRVAQRARIGNAHDVGVVPASAANPGADPPPRRAEDGASGAGRNGAVARNMSAATASMAPSPPPLIPLFARRHAAARRRAGGHASGGEAARTTVTVASWNLLHGAGATAADVEHLVRSWQPDLVLMQEATEAIDTLADRLGGHYARTPLPGRRHGLACWSREPFESAPETLVLPAGAFVDRISQIVRMPGWALANVHLSHGQMLNRRQLRHIATALPPRAAVLGDFNLVGPVLLRGFRDVGPRDPTHRMVDVVPLRIDRCLVRGITCNQASRLPRSRSDHHPIIVSLSW